MVCVLLFLEPRQCCAREDIVRWENFPAWGAPAGIPDAQSAIFTRTFQDAILLARHTALYWPCNTENDEVNIPWMILVDVPLCLLMEIQRFLRYFKRDRADLVKNMFRAIANIPFDLDLTNEETVKRLITDPLTYSPKFNRLSIRFLENHPGLNLPYGPGMPYYNCDNSPLSGPVQAFLIPIFHGSSALMSICKYTYEGSPMLTDVINPPNWARDMSKDQSGGPQYLAGYGCKNLGNIDNDWMDSTTAVMLHELFHFPGLFEDVPNYAASILTERNVEGTDPGSGRVEHLVSDWVGGPGQIPSDGYGAYNARLLNQLQPTDKNSGLQWDAIYNADNYAWYALSSCYSKQCGRDFKEAPDHDAAYPDRRLPPWPFDISPN